MGGCFRHRWVICRRGDGGGNDKCLSFLILPAGLVTMYSLLDCGGMVSSVEGVSDVACDGFEEIGVVSKDVVLIIHSIMPAC